MTDQHNYVNNTVNYYTELIEKLDNIYNDLDLQKENETALVAYLMNSKTDSLICIREVVKFSKQILNFEPQVSDKINNEIKTLAPQGFILEKDELVTSTTKESVLTLLKQMRESKKQHTKD